MIQNAGSFVALIAVAVFAGSVFYGFSRDVLYWYENRQWEHDEERVLAELKSIEITDQVIG